MKPAQKRLLSLKMTLANLLVNSKGISQRQAMKLANGIANSGIDHLTLCVANLRKIASLEKQRELSDQLIDSTKQVNVLLNERIKLLDSKQRVYLDIINNLDLSTDILLLVIVVLVSVLSIIIITAGV